MHPRYLAIIGPTASGKSNLALAVAKRLDGEIICADSRTIYKGMDIGTAKPSPMEQSSVRHWCLDAVNPDERYTASDFQRDANLAIQDILGRGKLPIIVGGSGLYVDGLIFNYQFGKDVDSSLRQELSDKSTEELIGMCQQRQIKLPDCPQNRRYLIRQLETASEIKLKSDQPQQAYMIGIKIDRAVLKSRINDRIIQMLKAGLIEETHSLVNKYDFDLEAMKSNIYSLADRFDRGLLTQEEFVDLATLKDYHLAKRQMTWFRRNKYIDWVELPIDEGKIVQKISSVLELG